jgi:hypothetical protein
MLLKSHKTILDNFYARSKQTVVDYDDLPASVRFALEKVKNTETLWCDSVRYLGDLATKDLIGLHGSW